MIIDGHVHVFLPDSESYPRTVDALAPRERTAPVELLISTMDENGVDGAVLVPLGPEDTYVAQCVAAHPGRFVGICVADDEVTGRVEGSDPEGALAKRVEAGGFKGLRMNWLGDPGRPIAASPAYATLRWLAAHELVLWFYGPTPQLALLAETVERFPELPVVLNHLGFCPDAIAVDAHARPRIDMAIPPPTLPTVIELARWPHVYVMLSGLYGFSHAEYPYLDLRGMVTSFYKAFGAERMLWASDFPWILEFPGYENLQALVGHHLPDLGARELEAVRGGSAMNIFKGAWQR
jgi:L-fuconolactonase